ncbi:MAG: hybrid sensor histidine kinase/response regulator, partial [Giesbergeria sp.]
MNLPARAHPAGEPAIKCLIVDDIAENLVALEALLRQDGVQILQAQSGAQALELLLTNDDIALALLDVQMPEMNGFELAALIRGRKRSRHIPLIFVTAGTHNTDWQFQGYESGAVDFLYKPVHPHVLLSKAEVFFTLHRQKIALARELAERTEALHINDMFVAVLGHDLRTPLASVTAAAGALARELPEGKPAALAQRILTSARRMGGMVEDLLDVTRIRQHGGFSLRVAPMQLDALSARAIGELGDVHGRSVELVAEGNLAGAWDGERLGQLLTNLLGNALRHGSADQPVRLVLDGTHADHVKMEVHNGGNIPANLLPVLFEPFRGRESRNGRQDGL